MSNLLINGVPLEERIEKEREFYDNPIVLSYSGLSKLLYSPSLFYRHYILKQRDDDETAASIEGSLIHSMILGDNLDEKYIVAKSKPTESVEKVLWALFNEIKANQKPEYAETFEYCLSDYSAELLMILERYNLYQSMKEETRLAKILTTENEEYFSFIVSSENKTIISPETFKLCSDIAYLVSTSPVYKYMHDSSFDFFDFSSRAGKVYNETMFEMSLFGEYGFNIRGQIDNLVVDYNNKEIRINDVKKTAKDLDTFVNHTIDSYKYWLQMAIYYILVNHNMSTICPEFDGSWKISLRFIIIDNYAQISSVLVSPETLNSWLTKTQEVFDRAHYHLTNNNFSLPYDYLISEKTI